MERYLDVGGIEIANPARTIAYMRNVGNACSVGDSVGCCVCDDAPAPCVPNLPMMMASAVLPPTPCDVPSTMTATSDPDFLDPPGSSIGLVVIDSSFLGGTASIVVDDTGQIVAGFGLFSAFSDPVATPAGDHFVLEPGYRATFLSGASPMSIASASVVSSSIPGGADVDVEVFSLLGVDNVRLTTTSATPPAGSWEVTIAVVFATPAADVRADFTFPADEASQTFVGREWTCVPDGLELVGSWLGTIAELGGSDLTATAYYEQAVGVREVGVDPPPTPPVSVPADGDVGWTLVSGTPAPLPAHPPLPFDATPATMAPTILGRIPISDPDGPIGTLYTLNDTGDPAAGKWIAWKPLGGALGPWVDLTATTTSFTIDGLPATDCEGDDPAPVASPIDAFTTPAADVAPWYDPADSRSAGVLGVWLNEMTLSSPHRRTAGDKLWGGTLSPRRLGRRELVVQGRVFVTNRASAEYARQWLYEALLGSECGEVRCNPPDAELRMFCPVEGDTGRRTLHSVGLIDWQWQLDPTAPQHCFVDFSATIASKVPWLTREPTLVHAGLVATGDTFCDICGTATSTGDCPPTTDPFAGLTCGCADQPARAVDTPQRLDCYARPSYVTRHYFAIASTKRWIDGALRITVHGGLDTDPTEPSLRNLRIRGWDNPDGVLPADGDTLLCSTPPTLDVQIGCVPYGATLVVDGSTRLASVVDAGGTVARSANAYLSSADGRVIWPEYSCGGLLIAVDADALMTAPDSTIEVEAIEVERG